MIALNRSVLILSLLLTLALASYAQEGKVTGRVIDESGEGLPFATIHVQGTTNGTTTNNQGVYALKLNPGQYDLVFKYVGYKSVVRSVSVTTTSVTLDIQLEPEILKLREVVINANGEDPAYQIIRNAIAAKKQFIREVESFDCDVYIKGLQRLDKRPKKFLGVTITVDTGIVYLSESVSQLSFRQPDKFKERMISSKVSGRNNAFSYNQASDMDVNFYENIVLEEVNERGYVSPIANSALLLYDYELVGSFEENGALINKIKVIPRRKNDPVFSGHIYIVEDSWRIHSTDLLLTKEHQMEFIDSLTVNQVYTPVNENNWLLLSQSFGFKFKVFGFHGSGYFIGVMSNYKVNPPREEGYFGNEVMFVEEGSNKRDSAYWDSIRPVPLTQLEVQDYYTKDSLQVIKDSKPYKDSVDRETNKLSVGNLLFSGYTHRNSYKRRSLSVQPLTSIFQYNTVEGLVTNLEINYRKSFEDNRFYRFRPELRYGFANNKFNGKMQALYYYKPKRFEYASVTFGRFVEQINPNEPISPIANTIYTLFERKNFMKIYQKAFVNFRHRREIANGLLLTSTLEYAERKELFNSTDYSIGGDDDRQYTPNRPVHNELANTGFITHQIFSLSLNLRIRIDQQYMTRPDRKINMGSKYPTIILGYKGAARNIFGSDISFNRVTARVSETLSVGLLGQSSIMAEAGGYIGGGTITFLDYRHFSGNQTSIGNYDLGNFQLLPYYQFSTTDTYFRAHYEHHFNGFIFNKFPLLRKLKPQAVISANYLVNDGLGNYLELGVGIEHILKFLRVDFYTAFNDSDTRTGFVFGFGF